MDMRGIGEALVGGIILLVIVSIISGIALWELGFYLYRHVSWHWS